MVNGDTTDARERLIASLRETGRVTDERILAALGRVPREAFVPRSHRESAYADRPLPIGDDQTISAPHMVGIMAEQLDLEPGESILEIGTGCGYHAAVTAEIVGPDHVFSVEYSPDLAEQARGTLAETGYADVTVRTGDGREGWSAHAPYDAAYLTCAAPDLPKTVVDQVRVGGRFVAPIGTGTQRLVTATKRPDGRCEKTTRGAVRFVTMRGDPPRD